MEWIDGYRENSDVQASKGMVQLKRNYFFGGHRTEYAYIFASFVESVNVCSKHLFHTYENHFQPQNFTIVRTFSGEEWIVSGCQYRVAEAIQAARMGELFNGRTS